MAGEATAESIGGLIDRWKQDAAEWRERMRKKIRVIMQNEEAPKDYDPFEDERRFYQKLLREHSRRGGYHESGSSLLKWILGVLMILTASTIIGGVTVYGRFSSLEGRVDEWQKNTQRQIDLNAQRINRLEERR